MFDLQADVRVNDYQKDSIVDILGRNHQGVPNNWRTRPEDGGEEEGKVEGVEVVKNIKRVSWSISVWHPVCAPICGSKLLLLYLATWTIRAE